MSVWSVVMCIPVCMCVVPPENNAIHYSGNKKNITLKHWMNFQENIVLMWNCNSLVQNNILELGLDQVLTSEHVTCKIKNNLHAKRPL